jgi:SagB-type dehydrogenase family enzyme
MKSSVFRTTAAVAAMSAAVFAAGSLSAQEAGMIPLPAPDLTGGAPLTRSLAGRRSVRSFSEASISLQDVAQLLWAAQGVTQEGPTPPGWRSEWGAWRGGLRTAPSAGALYPLEIYLVADRVEGLEPGLYRYVPVKHALTPVGDCGTRQLAGAALDQRAVSDAAAVVVVTGVYERTAAKYGERASRYVQIEVGAAGENLLLQATAVGLGAVFVGAFRDDAVSRVLGLPEDRAPLGLLPVGRPGGS